MLVRERMVSSPATTTPDTLLGEAGRHLLESNQKMLPVIDADGNLCGVISDRDLRLAADSPLEQETAQEIYERLQTHTVREVMTTTVHSIESDAPIVEAAQLMRVADVAGLPVVEYDESGNNERVVGLLTRTHLLDLLISMLEAEAVDENTEPPL